MNRLAIGITGWLVASVAQAEAVVHARASSQIVEVGDTFTLVVEATTDEETRVSSPAPGKTKPFKMVGRSGPTQQNQMTITNGQVERRQGISMSYVLQATKEGTFTIGPASADIGGILLHSASVKIKVVKVGMAPKKSVDPFGFFGDDDSFGSLRSQPQEKPAADTSLALAKADAPNLFFRFKPSKVKVVVGEVVSVPVYEYEDPTAPRLVAEEVVEPKAPDFVVRGYQATTKDLGVVHVGNDTWKVALARRLVLVPLRAGRATISSLRMRLRIGGQPAVRETGPLVIDVTEPPIKGRPPGYELGTVGQFALSAQIAPRAIEQGGAVTLAIELSGHGNFPTKLTMPAQDGIEFSESEMKDDLKIDEQGRFGGTRRFTSIIRILRAGQVAIGKVTLPFFDAQNGSYKVAEVDLGTVDVKGASAKVEPQPSDAQSKLASLPQPRTSLEGGTSRPKGALFGFTALALSGPVMLGLAALAARVRKWSRARRLQIDTPAGRLATALSALAEGKLEPSLADAAMTKAVEAAIEVYFGVQARGLSSDALQGALEAASTPAKIVTDAVSIVRAIEASRFMPGEVSAAEQKERTSRVERFVSEAKEVKR